jgi:hypothetical protein
VKILFFVILISVSSFAFAQETASEVKHTTTPAVSQFSENIETPPGMMVPDEEGATFAYHCEGKIAYSKADCLKEPEDKKDAPSETH